MLSRLEVEGVLKQTPEKRYKYFIRKVADENELWGLWGNGWAMAQTPEGEQSVPFWPASEYAQLCREGSWSEYQPKSVPLPDFVDTMLPDMIREGIRPAIFPLPQGSGIYLSNDDLVRDLEDELDRIE